jgi:O-antigen/teichoic acid export membrane protein
MSRYPAVGLSLRANFSWTFVGNVVYAGCQWGMLVVFAKLGSPEMLGQFALGLAISTPVVMLTNLQLRAIQATDAQHTYQPGDYLALRLTMTLLALLIITAIVAASGYRQQTALVILAVAGAKAIEAISDMCYGMFQQHERLDRVALSMMLRGVLGLLALGTGVALTNSALGGVLGLALAWIAVLVVYDMPGSRAIAGNVSISPRWHGPTMLRLVRLSAPLGVVMLLLALNASIPRYTVAQTWGAQALGIFAAIAYIERAGTTVVNALGQSASPRLARFYTTGDTGAFRALVFKLVGIGCGLGAAGVAVALIAGGPVLALLYQPEYARADILVWVMIAAGLWYIASFLGYTATARRIMVWQPVVLSAVVLVSLSASLLLIPAHGLIGAAQAMTASAAVGAGGYGMLLVIQPQAVQHDGRQHIS